MKKLVLLLSVIALLIIATGAVSAAKPAPDTFTITGYTTSYEYGTLPNGRTWFHVLAQSSGATLEDDAFCTALLGIPCQATCQTFLAKDCGVTGYFTGQFTFEEWGEVDLNPVTGAGSGKGKNNGVVTITAPDGTSVVRFNGKTDSQSVWGNFKIEKKEGTGAYADLKGNGDYTGNAGLVFSVTFNGKLKD
jgi:hypothetical protein